MSAWRRNAWLGILGAALLGLAALGADGLVALASEVYGRLPMLAPVFRSDHERQVRALHPLVAGLGLGALAACALASWRGVLVWPWLLALGKDGSRRDRLRTSAAGLAVLYSILFVPLRAARDVLREGELRGLSGAERRLRLYGVHSPEPAYEPIEAFRSASGGAGALLVARGGPQASFDDVFLATYLFPQRVFVRLDSDCSSDELPRLRAERPTASWVERACGDGRFAPVRVEPR